MDELISKRAVIEAIEKARANVGHNLERSIGKSIIEILDDVGRDIDRLPPAQPEKLTETHACDCISRQAAIEEIERWLGYIDDDMVRRMQIGMKRLPLAQPKPLQPWEVLAAQAVLPQPKMGKWIYHIDDIFPAESTMECNQCHAEQPLTCDDEFCPHCGAKMEVTT